MAEIPHPPGAFWKKKSFGDLPNWAWGGLIVGALVVLSVWSKNKKAGAAVATIGGDPIPGNIVPQYTFVDESTINLPNIVATPPPAPPAGPPVTPPVVVPPAATGPGRLIDPLRDYYASNQDGTEFSKYYARYQTDGQGAHNPVDNTPYGEWVTVDNGSLSDLHKIAQAVYGTDTNNGLGDAFVIARAPENGSVIAKRSLFSSIDENAHLQPGDRIWVPGVASTT